MTATLNGRTCTRVELDVPRYGMPRALVELDGDAEAAPEPGGLLLEVSGVAVVGTVVEQGERGGRRSVEMVGGFGGWSKPAPLRTAQRPAANRADNGVRLSRFAAELATDVGERLVALPGIDRAIGITVARLGEERAADVLSYACSLPQGAAVVPWWVRPSDGVTVRGPREGQAVEAVATDASATDSWRGYALVDASPLLPGAIIEGRAVEHLRIIATGESCLQVAVLSADDTLWATLRSAILSVIGPRVSALRVYRYQVIGIEADGRLRAQPRAKNLAPLLDGLPIWPGVAGYRVRPRIGSDILVQFADGDPGIPVVVGFQPAVAGGVGIPEKSEFDAARINMGDATERVARRSDGVDTGTFEILQVPFLSAIMVRYTSPAGTFRSWTIAGTGLSVADVQPVGSPPSVALRGEIDDVAQGKVYA